MIHNTKILFSTSQKETGVVILLSSPYQGEAGGVFITKTFNRTNITTKRKTLRRNLPLAEVILWNRLKGKQLEGYKFRRQYSVAHFVIDFYCPKLKLALEVDGDSHFTDDTDLSDIQRQSQIEIFGIHFLRFTNNEIYENLEGVLIQIAEKIKQITSPTPPCKGWD